MSYPIHFHNISFPRGVPPPSNYYLWIIILNHEDSVRTALLFPFLASSYLGTHNGNKKVYECKATTLPEVLSEFWSVVALYAQKKFSATVEDRDFAAHVLFVAAKCDLLKDYGMMRHLVREEINRIYSGRQRHNGRKDSNFPTMSISATVACRLPHIQ